MATPQWASELYDRLQKFDPQALQTAPYTSAHLATSGVSNQAAVNTQTGMNTALAWVNGVNSLAGQPGVLTHARLMALSMPAGSEQQKIAMYTLDRMQKLPAEQQQILLQQHLADPTKIASTLQAISLQGVSAGTYTNKDQSVAPAVQSQGGLANAQARIDAALFPTLQGVMASDPNAQGIGEKLLGSPTPKSDTSIWGEFKQHVTDPFAQTLDQIGQDLSTGGVLGAGEAFLHSFMGVGAAPFHVLGAIGQDVRTGSTGIPVLGQGLRATEDVLGAGAAAINFGVGRANWALANTVGAGAARLAGLHPGTTSYDQTKDLVGGVSTAIALQVAGDVGGDLAKTSSLPEDIAAPQIAPGVKVGQSIVDAAKQAISDPRTSLASKLNGRAVLRAAVGQEVLNLAGKNTQEWLDGAGGTKFLGKANDIIKEDPANAEYNLTRRMHMPQAAAKALADNPPELQKQAFLDSINPNEPASIAAERDALMATKEAAQRKIDTLAIGRSDTPQTEARANTTNAEEDFAAYQAQQDAQATIQNADAQLADLAARKSQPLMEFPKESRVAEYFKNGPASNSKIGGVFNTLMHPIWRLGHNASEMIDRNPRIINPIRAGLLKDNTDVTQHNIDTFETFTSRLGIDAATRSRLGQQLLDAKTEQDVWQWADDVKAEIRKTKFYGLAAPSTKEALTNWFKDRGTQDRGASPTVDETGGWKPALQYKDGQAAPADDSEFLGSYIDLPSAETLMDASSWLRRNARTWLETGNKTQHNFAEFGYYVPKAMMSLSTAILKAPPLMLHAPSILLKESLQAMVNARTEGLKGFTSEDPMSEWMTPSDKAGLSSGIRSSYDDAKDARTRVIFDTHSFDNGVVTPQDAHYEAALGHLRQVSSSSLMRELASHPLDETGIEETLNALHTEGSQLNRYYEGLQRAVNERIAEEQGIPLDQVDREWLQGRQDYIKQVTSGGDQDFLDAIATGRLKKQGATVAARGIDVQDHTEGTSLRYRYDRLRSEQTDVDNALREPGTDEATRTALYMRQREISTELGDLKAEWGDGPIEDGTTDPNYVNLNADGKAVDELRARWNAGTYKWQKLLNVDYHSRKFVPGEMDVAERMQNVADNMSRWFYDKLKSVDISHQMESKPFGIRSGIYRQRENQIYEGLRNQGWDDKLAARWASVKAAEFTRDITYTLNQRSTLERQVKNIFWFAPVQIQSLYQYLWRIPKDMGGVGFGIPLEVAKVENYINLAKNMGWVSADPRTGEDSVTLPGVSQLMSLATGGAVNIARTPLKDLAIPTSNIGITAHGLPAMILGTAAEKFGGPFLDLAKTVEPNGPETFGSLSLVPSNVVQGLEALGFNVPFSGEVAGQISDVAHDQALQYAFAAVGPQPQTGGYAAYKAWLTQVQSKANSIQRGVALAGAITKTISPFQIGFSSTEKDAYWKWYQSHITFQQGQQGYTPEQKAELLQYHSDHPNSASFGISYQEYTGKPVPRGFQYDPESPWMASFLGLKGTMNPDDYAKVASVMLEKQWLQGVQAHALEQIAPQINKRGVTSPAAGARVALQLLQNGYQKAQAFQDYADTWSRYQTTHKAEYDLYQTKVDSMGKALGFEEPGYEQNTAAMAVSSIKQLQDQLQNSGGVLSSDVKTTMAKLNGILYSKPSTFHGPQPEWQKALGAYYKNVVDPYITQTSPLYDQAAKLQEQGRSDLAAPIYDKIRTLENQASANGGFSYHGVQFPSYEQYSYDALSPTAKKYKLASLASKPISWLTDEQRKIVGYQNFQGEDQMWQQIQAADTQFHDAVAANNVSTTSSAYQDMKATAQKAEAGIAAQYGQAGTQAYQLDNGAPYTRMRATGMFQSDPYMQDVMQAADWITQKLTAAGDSPLGSSALAVQTKLVMYNAIQQYMADPSPQGQQFRDDIKQLQYSSPLPGKESRQGAPLYEAIFFDQWNPAYIAPELTQAAGG